jgi:S1-C subfamily serine protease
MVRQVVNAAVGGATAVVRPWLGVKGDTVSQDIASSLGLDRPRGIVVTDLYPNGPAARAGVREGDVITAVDGAEVHDQNGLNFRVGSRDPGDAVQVTLLRDGRSQTLNARAQRLPGEADLDNARLIRTGALSGASVLALNPALADSLGGDPFASGVIIGRVERGSFAQATGFQPGDVLVSVNDRPIGSVEQAGGVTRGSRVVIQRQGRLIPGVIR